MDHRYGPDDEDAFLAARDEFVSRFEQTPAGHDFGWVASQVLEFKWAYLDGDLTGWSSGHVDEILLGLYPAKVMLDPDDTGPVVAGFAGFLRFLGDEGLASPGDTERLAEHVEELTPQFHVAALDERNWSPGKRLWSQARSEGVDITDPEALQRFSDDFNRRPFVERDAVLGTMSPPATSSLAEFLIGPLPPVVLPPTEELEAAAGETVYFERLRRLVGYVGAGRPLTEKGNLKLADGKALVELLETADRFNPKFGDRVYKTRSSADLNGVDLAFRIAVESNMLMREGRKLLRGPNAGWAEDPLALIYGAWLVLLNRIGPTQHWYRNDRYGWGWFAEELDRALPLILIGLYRDGDALIDEVVGDEWGRLLAIFDLDHLDEDGLEFERSLVDPALRRALDALADLGMVTIANVEEVPAEFGGTDRVGGVVELTSLGKWAVQRIASKSTRAPIVGGFRETTATELLRAASDIPEAEAIAEIDEWVNHRGDDAAPELVEALRTADETGRSLGFRALLRFGPGAEAAVSELGNDPELAPYVTVWRVDTLAGSPDEMDCAGDPDRFIRLLGAVMELWGPEAAAQVWAGPAAGADGIASMVDRAWRVARPETEPVLAAIGAEYPEKAVAKAARRALFKYRSVR